MCYLLPSHGFFGACPLTMRNISTLMVSYYSRQSPQALKPLNFHSRHFQLYPNGRAKGGKTHVRTDIGIERLSFKLVIVILKPSHM